MCMGCYKASGKCVYNKMERYSIIFSEKLVMAESYDREKVGI